MDGGIVTALTIIGSGLQAISTIQQGQAQARSAKFNAAIAEQNAVLARQTAAADAEKRRRELARATGRTRARFGTAGLTVEGSPLETLGDLTAEGELSARNALFDGEIEARRFQSQSSLLRSQARDARTSGFLRAGTSLLFAGARLGSSTTSRTTNTPTVSGPGPGAGPPLRN